MSPKSAKRKVQPNGGASLPDSTTDTWSNSATVNSSMCVSAPFDACCSVVVLLTVLFRADPECQINSDAIANCVCRAKRQYREAKYVAFSACMLDKGLEPPAPRFPPCNHGQECACGLEPSVISRWRVDRSTKENAWLRCLIKSSLRCSSNLP